MFVSEDRIVTGKSTLLLLTLLKREDLSMESQEGRAGSVLRTGTLEIQIPILTAPTPCENEGFLCVLSTRFSSWL